MSSRHLYELDRSSPQFQDQLFLLLCDKEYVERLKELPEDELMELINCLDDVSFPLRSEKRG